ncbi:MAG: hypothetical protein ABSB74_12455 [Tepidisphaeraceae bacterium]
MATSAPATGVARFFLEAVGKFAAARLRGVGALTVHPDWQVRAAICERCPLRVIRCGVSYCGNPLLQQIDRDPAMDGCGCACRDKAKSPSEHCPIDHRHGPARRGGADCSCKWCARVNPKPETRTPARRDLAMTNQIRNQKSEAAVVSSF